MSISQKEKILIELKKGRMLTRRQIRNELNINSETGRIMELRNEGNNIENLICKSKNGARYVKYYLIANNVRRKF